jgi:O-antigen ligase
VPLAVLILGIQQSRDDLYRLLPILIGLIALSGLLGLLQAIGGSQGVLYLYRITNNGSAVGFFANRNHAATLLACLFPLLAVFAATAKGTADQQNSRQLLAAALAIVAIPLMLVTGSRSGLLGAGIGLVGAMLIYCKPNPDRVARRGQKSFTIGAAPLLGGLAALSIGFLTYFFARAEAVDRMFRPTAAEFGRSDYWLVSGDLFWKYFPWGSGSGSFVEAYQIAEPTKLLSNSYLNHAHNDWLEIAVTFGLPGILLLFVAAIAFLSRFFVLSFRSNGTRRAVMFGRMAGIDLLILALASVSDYPLRTPIMLGVFALLVLWFIEAGREHAGSSAAMEKATAGLEE